MPDVYGVFQGGGVRGTSLVGGLAAAEQRQYQFAGVAGTSAGAIVASLLAVGYNATDMLDMLVAKNFMDFLDPAVIWGTRWVRYPWTMGFYKGDSFRNWLNGLMEKKLNKALPTMNDVVIPLTIVASDIGRGEMAVFKGPSYAPGAKNSDVPIADAVRASMSIPGYFVPFRYLGTTFVDGGILSNFPAWAFEEEQSINPRPILGFQLEEKQISGSIRNLLQLLLATTSTIINENVQIDSQTPGLNVIPLPTLGVKTTDFGISDKDKVQMYTEGLRQAGAWLDTNQLNPP